MGGSDGKPKCSIKVFKIYLASKETVNLLLWMAMMALVVPEIQRHEYEHLMVSGAIGFGVFSAVIARLNRLFFTMGAMSTDGSVEKNK